MRGEDHMHVFRREYIAEKVGGPILEVPKPLPSGHQATGPISKKKKMEEDADGK